jgi:predicted nucleotidyltransferase component of viral defense system
MIRNSEIQKLANRDGVRDTQTEKDYILSWILAGISQNTDLRNVLAFKGGTVLKKFYFENYRYSEDLDFTLTNETVDNEALLNCFISAFRFIKKEANIDLDITDFSEHETGTINFYITYIGPLGGVNARKNVKVDISRNELLLFALDDRKMFDLYSDHPRAHIHCYSLEEVLTEKMRSLLSRQQPRDFYDLWYLSANNEMDMSNYTVEFSAKAKFKGLDPTKLEKRVGELFPLFKARWEGSLSEQIANLPPFDRVSREMKRYFRKLFA